MAVKIPDGAPGSKWPAVGLDPTKYKTTKPGWEKAAAKKKKVLRGDHATTTRLLTPDMSTSRDVLRELSTLSDLELVCYNKEHGRLSFVPSKARWGKAVNRSSHSSNDTKEDVLGMTGFNVDIPLYQAEGGAFDEKWDDDWRRIIVDGILERCLVFADVGERTAKTSTCWLGRPVITVAALHYSLYVDFYCRLSYEKTRRP